MFFISYEDQLRIKRRMKRLPDFMRREEMTILVFESVSTLLLAYGVCISIFKHPIEQNIPDPACDIFIACFYYFALSVAAPFTGGHMNPATTIAFNFLKKNNHKKFYFIAQFLGATIASFIGTCFFIKPCFFFQLFPLLTLKNRTFGLAFWTQWGRRLGFL